ncbi:class F sortase [Streptomyces sp. 6N223]|uniref:class F sortase n=1 Tax=Streptomyces sp. 6N223 TaxID=3457412 RepID=UPI003FD2F1A1
MVHRLASCVTWTLLLLALWAWGLHLTDGPVFGGGAPTVRAAPLAGAPAPRRLEIDAIGVSADIVARGVDADGGVAPPPFDTPQAVGWYAGGPTPGAVGAAVLVGHVDTRSEPAVFYALSTLRPGDGVRVTRADGSTATFAVGEVEVIDRDDFDPGHVYGPRDPGAAELRLITCGGSYDPDRRAYSANVVVSAYLTGSGSGSGSGSR